MSRTAGWIFASFVFVVVCALTLGISLAQADEGSDVRAEIIDRDGAVVGEATFDRTDDGAVRIRMRIEGLAAAAGGERAIHIHEFGVCETPDFASAGAHFDPDGAEHGLLHPDGPHAGDLPNLPFDPDGNADYEVLTKRVTLDDGDRSLVADEGTSIVVHELRDDYVGGDTGGRIACGVIRVSSAASTEGQASSSEDGADAAFADVISRGQSIYMENCASCHGSELEGSVGGDIPRLANDSGLDNLDHVLGQIIRGGEYMPPFGRLLGDAEIAAVATFIRTTHENDFGPVTEEQVAETR
jgi:superoxide dismutase, Cu-Zn family